MQNIEVGKLAEAMKNAMGVLVSTLSIPGGPRQTLEPPDLLRETICKPFDELGKVAEQFGAHVTTRRCANLRASIYRDRLLNLETLWHEVQTIVTDLTFELSGTRALFLGEQGAAMYVSGAFDLFGDNVCMSFPSIVDDLDEAIKCLALERPTACVFHLMRCCEAVAGAVALSLGVTIPANPKPSESGWGYFAKETGKRIAAYNADRNAAPPDWPSKAAFYSEVEADFRALQRAWRNPTMHMDKTYSLERAKQIMDAVTSALTHVAAHLDEKGFYLL